MSKEEKPRYRMVQVARNDDLDLLIAVASVFYLYRKFEKAAAVLAVADHLEPGSRPVLELQAVVLSEMNQYQSVLDIIDEIENSKSPLAIEIGAIKRRALRALKPSAST